MAKMHQPQTQSQHVDAPEVGARDDMRRRHVCGLNPDAEVDVVASVVGVAQVRQRLRVGLGTGTGGAAEWGLSVRGHSDDGIRVELQKA